MSNSFLKDTAYSLLDLVTLKRGILRRINGMKVRFPPRWSRYFNREYEKDNYDFIKDHVKHGMHVIDIGAHIGLFSVCTSQLAGPTGKIVCFEPTPGTFEILKNTLKLNHCDNVIPRREAVGSTAGKATFYVSDEIVGCNSNSLVQMNKSRQAGQDVMVTTVDDICRDHALKPGLIKIDVEGAELNVLKGAGRTMKNERPIMIVGLHPVFIKKNGDSLTEIWTIIKENGYRVNFENKDLNEKEFVSHDNLFDVRLIPA